MIRKIRLLALIASAGLFYACNASRVAGAGGTSSADGYANSSSSSRATSQSSQSNNTESLLGHAPIEEVSSRITLLAGQTEEMRGDSGVAVVTNSMGSTETVLSVTDGEYSQEVEVAHGSNSVEVFIYDGDELVESSKSQIISTAETVPVRIRMSWATPLNDVDLYVTAPDGSECNFENESTDWGFLDIDDTDGYGPETISITDPISGTYKIGVNYYDIKTYTGTVNVKFQISFDEGPWESAGTYVFEQTDADAGVTIVPISNFSL